MAGAPSHGRTRIPADANSEVLSLHRSAASPCGSDTDRYMSGGGQHRRENAAEAFCLLLFRSTASVFRHGFRSSFSSEAASRAQGSESATDPRSRFDTLGGESAQARAQNNAQPPQGGEQATRGAGLADSWWTAQRNGKRRWCRESVKAALT